MPVTRSPQQTTPRENPAIGTAGLITGFALGVVCGGLLVTGNFHLAYRSLNRSFQGGRPPAFPVVMAKHYLRFLVTGVIIFVLISNGIGSPLGLLLGLSVVVVSLLAASIVEARRMMREKSQG